MMANVVNLFPERRASDYTLRPIKIDEWHERLVRMSVKWLHLRRCDVLTFLSITTTMDEHSVIVEFDSTGRNAEVVSGSSDKARGWFGELLTRTVVPNMVYLDQPCGYSLDSTILVHPTQFLIIPLPTGEQMFAAVVF